MSRTELTVNRPVELDESRPDAVAGGCTDNLASGKSSSKADDPLPLESVSFSYGRL